LSIQPSPKSYVVAVCLSAIFGVVGVQHFYMGRYVEGLIDVGLLASTVYFFFAGNVPLAIGFAVIDGLHTFVVTILLLMGSFNDGQGQRICYPGQRIA
jgi:hypothetical protein